MAALGTPHARAERRHRNLIGPAIDIDFGMTATSAAGDEQPTHAVVAHVAGRHRADWFVIPGHISKLRTDREQNQGHCPDGPEPI
jgi:hypothetical protein